jgi:hypothetical protein
VTPTVLLYPNVFLQGDGGSPGSLDFNTSLSEGLAVTDDNLNVVHVRCVGQVWRVTRTSLTNLIEPTTVFDVPLNGGFLIQVATSETCTVLFIAGEFEGKHVSYQNVG